MSVGVILDYSRNVVEFKGKRYCVDSSFDNVLLIYKLYAEEVLDSRDKINQALKMLVKNHFKLWLLTESEKAELLDRITEEKIKLPQRPQIGPPRRLMDFDADSDYIYASFKQAYNMDLLKERGKLEWKNFCKLLDGLPDKTKLKEVMRIRAMEVPELTRYNQKERQNIIELKAYYELPVKGNNKEGGLDMLFNALEGIASHG